MRFCCKFVIVITAFFLALPPLMWATDLENRVHKTVLSNGLAVLILERHISPTVALYIRHRAGAVDEALGETGLAHFLEHMMFKGTTSIGTSDYQKEQITLRRISETGQAIDLERRKGIGADGKKISEAQARLDSLQKAHRKFYIPNEIDRLYTENGAEHFNATTSQDLTSYYVSLPSNKIELWARIEADRMTNPVFRDFYVERQVIMEERRQRVESNPSGKLYETFMATAFQAHPYGRPTLGWSSDMSYLSESAMEEFFRRFYAPNNTVIAIVGSVDAETTLKLVKKYFASIPSQPLPLPPVTEEPQQKGERRMTLAWNANPRLIIGYHKPNMPHRDDYILDMVESILIRGRSSRLKRFLIQQEGAAESIDIRNGLPGNRYPNLFTIFASPKTPCPPETLERLIYGEIERLKVEEVSPEELGKTKNLLRADYIRGLSSNEGLAEKLSYFEAMTGDYRYMTTYLTNMDAVTADDIRQAAAKYLTAENRTVGILIPEKSDPQNP